MGAVEPGHLVVILLIALLVLGLGRVGELGGTLGRAVRDVRDAADGKVPSEPARCVNCRAAIPADARFCPGCGLAAASVRTDTRPDARGRLGRQPRPAARAELRATLGNPRTAARAEARRPRRERRPRRPVLVLDRRAEVLDALAERAPDLAEATGTEDHEDDEEDDDEMDRLQGSHDVRV